MTGNAIITNSKEMWKQFLKKYESDLKKMVTMRGGKMTVNANSINTKQIWKQFLKKYENNLLRNMKIICCGDHEGWEDDWRGRQRLEWHSCSWSEQREKKRGT